MTTLYERGPFLRPTLRNAVVNERILAKLDSAPVADLGGKAIGTMNANGVLLDTILCNLFNTSSGVARFSTSIE